MSRVSEEELNSFAQFIREWALKRMLRFEKKLLFHSRIYFGESGTITYETPMMKRIVFPDGEYFEIPKIPKKEEP